MALLVVIAMWPCHVNAEPEAPAAPEEPPAPVADPVPVADPAPPPAPAPAPAPSPPAPHFPQHFLFGNGLALVLTRLSVGYEFLYIAHHSLGFSIHGQYGGGIASELVGVKGAFVGLGGEVGYRFYAWRDGPFGPFLGLSLLAGYYHTQSSIFRIDPKAFRYLQYGPAVDLGWSVHLDRTTVLAVALGAQYTAVTVDPLTLPDLTRLLVGDGPRPRGQIQVGKTF